MTHKLLSLPPNLVDSFHEVTGLSNTEYFCTSDPVGSRLGSGGGTTWLLEQCHRAWAPDTTFESWLSSGRRILLHAGGQSRRLPAYAPSGKILTPIPIFRWERGQRLSQTLLDLQIPLYERIMDKAPEGLNTMIVSGDVYIRASEQLGAIPKADVVCYGLWLDSSIAKDHGVFFSRHSSPTTLDRMLQKPSVDTLSALLQEGYYLTDIGVWILSDRAVEVLRRRSRDSEGNLKEYDLYSDFGRALGVNPSHPDPELAELTVEILPLPGGEFYHYGTSREMISSTLAIQNIVNDQREIMHRDRKPHPSIFVQNSITRIPFSPSNTNVWVENSYIGPRWTLTGDNIVTGVPENDWEITLNPGQCIDIVPLGADKWMVRVYGIDDKFAGHEQQRPQFPVVDNTDDMGRMVRLMLEGGMIEDGVELMSAEQISDIASLPRLVSQRRRFRNANRMAMARNHRHSVFYQADLDEEANAFASENIPLPEPLTPESPLLKRMSDSMWRGEILRRRGEEGWRELENDAFSLLRSGLIDTLGTTPNTPRRAVCSDQIVWSRSPVRIDIAGGWTDTPPFCLEEGGNVINLAIELNGQPPLQTYIRPSREPHIVCRSIDLGASEIVSTFDQLIGFNKVGSPFSIPKAALALAGFHPRFCREQYPSLKAQLESMGGGLEITLFSAIPAGSGLGTSSILAATVLGAVSDFCDLAWDKVEICRRTLVLEQLLTTGGGWQDQYGGVIGGVKLLHTSKGFDQTPMVRRLPSDLFTSPDYAPCHLLYYTGLTRTAKDILGEIVRRMFLNQGRQLELLRRMKAHTLEMYDAIQRDDFMRMGTLMRETWRQNCRLDPGTNPDAVEAISRLVDDLCLGYKLPGAGGGGYLYMIAKDIEAASRIKHILQTTPGLPSNGRMVDMTLSRQGLNVTRS
ncbi:MAG: bifunctional fucokinase/fucose-1-phosphate guanylyltransferase [Muribaculaceae bacterium]|nr:bifunctional fucokinase/fucose-1-phosphate guanylyltransferase [Muribaculaceae bacterium]